jgi:hypothetical protein
MTEQSSEPTLILQSSDTRIVVHGSLFVAWNGENPAQCYAPPSLPPPGSQARSFASVKRVALPQHRKCRC